MTAAPLPGPDQSLLKKLRLRIETDDPLYPGWRKLKIRGKDLNDLPSEVFWLNELEVLDLSPEREACINYRIGRLPPGIGNLTGLRVLMLDTNELDVLPSEICLLTMLEKLTLSNNYLRKLPEGFHHLQRLDTLYLANNRFDKINLHMLWIGYNRIRHLPVAFHRLANLDWGVNGHTTSLAVDGNPLVDPPVDICRQGVIAISEYMNEFGGRIVYTPAPAVTVVATTPVPSSAVVVAKVPPPKPSPPPPRPTTVIETRSRTPLVELHPRYSDIDSLPPPDALPILLPVDPYLDLTYYGTDHR